jgi:ribosomal protein S18 acetylase RimI-like enzyme
VLPSNTIVAIVSADDPRVVEARMLLLEYTESLDVDLSFQNFDQELREFPGGYLPPSGALLLATRSGKLTGSVAMRQLDAEACEMKRLYVRPGSRGLGVGRALAVAVIDAARDRGYRQMRLDTLAGMDDAQGLYRTLGFREIGAYYENPVPGTRYLELDLR